jgi:hypothetical protein
MTTTRTALQTRPPVASPSKTSVASNAPTAPARADVSNVAPGRTPGVRDEFLKWGGDLAKEREQKAAELRRRLDKLPTGILTGEAVKEFRLLTQELKRQAPVVGLQKFEDQVLKIIRTDFEQAEVPGLAPSGDVFQVLADGDTRANFSKFTRPDGAVVNAVEFGTLRPNASGSSIEIKGLYAFSAVEPPLSPRELMTLTKAMKKTLAVVGLIDEARGQGAQVGPRPPEAVNRFLTAIKNNRLGPKTLETMFTPGVRVENEKKKAILDLEEGLTKEERAVLKKVGQVFDLNTVLGPVAGPIPRVGEGFQQFLSIQGTEPGSKVVFESGSSFNLEGNPVRDVTEQGERGYRYTFEAIRLGM